MTFRTTAMLVLASTFVLPLQAAHAGVIRDSNRLASIKSVAEKGVKVAKDGVAIVKFVGPCIARRLTGGRC